MIVLCLLTVVSKINISGLSRRQAWVSEFMLRIMAWLSTRDDSCSHSQMCIVAGPNIDMAIKLIKRVKNIFETKLGLTFQNKEKCTRVKRLHHSYTFNRGRHWSALPTPLWLHRSS